MLASGWTYLGQVGSGFRTGLVFTHLNGSARKPDQPVLFKRLRVDQFQKTGTVLESVEYVEERPLSTHSWPGTL